ncbi:MAG: thioredoxin family protein [bacterium]|nr:thioredoxin family protein [bacterium]
MNKNTGIIIGVIALVVIVGGVYASMNKKDDAMMVKEKMEQQAMEADKMAAQKAMEEKDAMMKKDETSVMDKEVEKSDVMMKGSYEAYSSEKIARAETGDVVLFFHASWCPSCRSLNADIEANIGSIPEGVSILKVDYDKETELKKKYGVTYQHTLVQVDKNGNLIKKWSGSPKLSNLVSEIQ